MIYPIVKLEDICEIIAGQSPPSSTYNFDGHGLPFFQGKADFGTLYPKTRIWCDEPRRIAYPNDILISVRAPVGPTNICQGEACIGRGLSAIRAKDGTDFKYVLYYLRAIETQLSAKGRGSTFSAITQSEIQCLKIPFPPLHIQKQIASILEKADLIREKRRQVRQQMDTFLRSVFLEMFGDPVTNPKGWDIRLINDITSLVSSGSTPLGGESTYIPEGIFFIRSQNILMNQIDYSKIAHISCEVHKKMKRTWVKNNDILLNITGASIGRIAYFRGESDSANVNQHVCIIRPIKSMVLPEFLSYLISMPMYQKHILSKNSGATRQAFNFEEIRKFRVMLPPLGEQKRFTILFNKIELLKTRQIDSEEELKNLFNSLMEKAFN